MASTKRKTPNDSDAPVAEGFRTLLVPVDLTPSSDRVLGRLLLLPLAKDARVTLLHVVPGGLHPPEERRATRDAQKALVDEVRHLREQLHGKARLEAVVKVGSAAKEIAGCVAEVRPDLIVMGRGGGRVLRDAFLGSTAERVLRQAQRPVLVVRLAPRAPYRRPALALARDQAAQEVVRLMLLALPPPRPQVEVIHAFDALYQGLIYPSLSEDEAEERMDELRTNATRELSELLASALAKAGARPEDGPSWKTHVRYGSPRTIVDKAIKKAETDLLLVGTRGASAASYVFLGTVAGDLLRAAKCDVLVVPPASPSE